MEVVKCTNAKTEYEYTRYWREELDEATLRSILYKNATQGKNRHYRLHTVGNKNGRGITYYDITCGFDCETYTDLTKRLGYMYIWQMCINGVVIKGRTYEEFITLLDDCKHILQPKENHRLLCFIHNAGYEFAWFRSWLNLDDPNQNFLKDTRQPLKLTHCHFIEFRDSMALVGGDSLAGLAKKYTNTQKCKGDLDYNIPRNRFTKLTTEADYGDGVPREEEYCDNDVLILHEFARWVFDDLMSTYTKLPMTQTGILTNECKYLLHELNKDVNGWHQRNIERSPANGEIYNIQSNFLYRGGFTHACVDIVEVIQNDLMGVDITSSYPYVMTQKCFPSKFEKVGTVTEERVSNDIKAGRVSIFVAEFSDLYTTGLHSIESKHKCIKLDANAVIDNGRVYSAKNIMVYLTSYDWQNYQHYYTWSSVKITQYEVSETRHLYKHIVQPMLKYYRIKAELKAQHLPYGIQKAKVNSFYGLCVKRQNGKQTKYCNSGFSEDDAKTYEEQLKNSITCFYDGVFISAVARWRLLTLAYDVYTKFGIKSVYCDTDSHKFLNPTQALVDYIEELNKTIEADNVKNIEFYTEYNAHYADLGCWDIEFYPMSMYDPDSKNTYIKRFLTLGAKRYIIEVDQFNKDKNAREIILNQTVAGLPKGEMLKQYGTIDNCFNKFSNNMQITGCKLMSHYVDEPYKITVTDKQGNTDTHVELSCCALLPTDFSLTIDEIWRAWYIDIAADRQGDNREQRLI